MRSMQKFALHLLMCCCSMLVFAQGDSLGVGKIHDLNTGSFELRSFEAAKHKPESSVIYFETENAKLNSGRIILNLSTLNQEEVQVSWQNYSGRIRNSVWCVRLQYRLSESEDWKDVTDSRNRPYEFSTAKRAKTRNFSDVTLPQECENKSFVQLSWKLYRLRGKGKAPNVQTRRIEISSKKDPYFGLAAQIIPSAIRTKGFAEIKKLNFNHIPLPYTYPETIRLRLDGKYIRDIVKLEISGADKSYFSIDTKKTDLKKSSKTVTVSYAPKKEGKHKAVLTITTRKLQKDVVIPLEGSCAKASELMQNFIEDTFSAEDEMHYNINVFSNKEYQFRMRVKDEQEEDWQQEDALTKTNVFVIYKWYRDGVCLRTMEDEVKSRNYCVPLQSPQSANRIEISILNNDALELSDFYFGFPQPKRIVRSGDWNNPDIWEPKGEASMEDFVYIEDSCKVRVTSDVLCSMLMLGDDVNVDISDGKMFYVSGDIVYGNRSYFTVRQNLLSERWNYISSPINKAKALIFSMRKSGNETWLMRYNTGVVSKHGDHWSEYLVDPNFVLVPGQGYAVYTHDSLDVKYEGLLCNSQTVVSLVSKNNDKWNLVGNPFTAPLSTKKLFEDFDGKIQGNAIFLFDRENLVYNPIIVDSEEEVMIPPLESFFVETLQEGEEITFKRSHQYIPKTGTGSTVNYNYLSLAAISHGRQQYALMGMIDDAEYGFDNYDAHKMFGISEDMPEIYFLAEGEELSVNTFPDYPAAFDVGLYVGTDAGVELQLNNLSVLPENVSVILEDKYENKFYDLCLQNRIFAKLKNGTTNDRYRIYLNKAINVYEVHTDYSGIYIWNDANRIFVYGDGTHRLQKVRVKNADRVLVGEQNFDSNVMIFDKDIEKGRYTVDIQIDGEWLNDFITEIR